MSLSTIIPISPSEQGLLCESFLDSAVKENLKTVGIVPSAIPDSMNTIQLYIYNRAVKGVGFRNNNGGIEFYSPQFNDLLSEKYKKDAEFRAAREQDYLRKNLKNFRLPHRKEVEKRLSSGSLSSIDTDTIPSLATVTLKAPGVLYFQKRKGTPTKQCCLFADFLDYLSYLTIMRTAPHPLMVDCDFIVMNNVRNFPTVVVDSENYERVFCVFPNTTVGNTMFQTLKTRRKSSVVDLSSIYAGNQSINEYARTLKN